MRKTVHLCLSSHNEVMYRSEEDLIMGFNCLALAVIETGARLLAEGFMTTHNHQLLQVDDWRETKRLERYSYTRYFNSKYSRRGRLGEPSPFCLEVVGTYHLQSALNYVLRQGLHHGLSTSPFGYQHCSANAFFRQELGKDFTPHLLAQSAQYKYLPDGKKLPRGYRMRENGLILREDVIDTSYVEKEYQSVRSFCYLMNRLSDDKYLQEQSGENDLPPVTLETIEKGVKDFDVKAALISEQGRVNTSLMTDLEMCHLIDDIYLPAFSGGEPRLPSIRYRKPGERTSAMPSFRIVMMRAAGIQRFAATPQNYSWDDSPIKPKSVDALRYNLIFLRETEIMTIISVSCGGTTEILLQSAHETEN